jgi:hypothetical protein
MILFLAAARDWGQRRLVQNPSRSKPSTIMKLLALAAAALNLLGVSATAATNVQREVVIAHYNEDLSWVAKEISPDVQVSLYSKSVNAPISTDAIVLPNVGREGHTFLAHIVDRYDTLAEWTVFTQAAAPTPGNNRRHSHPLTNGGHLVPPYRFADYLVSGGENDAFFVYSSTVKLQSLDHSIRFQFGERALSPVTNKTDKSVCGASSDWTLWFTLDQLLDHRRNMMVAQATESKAGSMWADEFYTKYVEPGAPSPTLVDYSQGSRFAVGRKRILARPKEYYEALLSTVSHSKDPLAGYWIEFFWSDVFCAQEEQGPCALADDTYYEGNNAMWEDFANRSPVPLSPAELEQLVKRQLMSSSEATLTSITQSNFIHAVRFFKNTYTDDDVTNGESTYGPIDNWDVSSVTNLNSGKWLPPCLDKRVPSTLLIPLFVPPPHLRSSCETL